jgi:PIN domain nuclease of toxin-antitoxin system
VKLLLDSHIWAWIHADRERITDALKAQLESAERVAVSVASVWEVGIKHASGKLEIDGGIHALHSAIEHALRAAALPPHHRDPFDRMLVAQAEVEGMTLVTADELVWGYGGHVLWAGP